MSTAEVILAIQAAALAGDYLLVLDLRERYKLNVCVHCAGVLPNRAVALCRCCWSDVKIWVAVYRQPLWTLI
jgi:hypothetical protein